MELAAQLIWAKKSLSPAPAFYAGLSPQDTVDASEQGLAMLEIVAKRGYTELIAALYHRRDMNAELRLGQELDGLMEWVKE